MTTPSFDSFEGFDLDALRASIGDVEIPTTPIEEPTFTEPIVKRRRGRPRKNPLPETTESIDTSFIDEAPVVFAPVPLTKRAEKDVAERLQQIFTGGTSIPSMMLDKEYLKMTDEEAAAIAVPLASYLSRNADTIPVARQIIENYDLAGVILGVLMYTMRLYRDRKLEVDSTKQASRTSVEQRSVVREERQEVWDASRAATPGASSYGIAPQI